MRHENLHINKLRINKLFDANNNEITGLISPLGGVSIFDDFIGVAGVLDAVQWTHSGDGAGEAAIVASQNGDARLTTSATDNEGTIIAGDHPVRADWGGVFMEARLKSVTDVATCSIFCGFSDSAALEEPMSYSGTTLTTTLSDGAGFIYDTDGTTDFWIPACVDTNVDDSIGLLSSLPVADTYQTLRIEVSKDGLTVKFFINGNPVGTANTAGVTETVSLYPVITVYNRSAEANVVDVDYIHYGHDRV